MKLVERDLEFEFAGALNAFKFDDGRAQTTSSLQAVDFIVEYPHCYRFIEVKDPDEAGAANVKAFADKLKSGRLIRSLAGKYRDSYFFRALAGKNTKKIEYVVLLAMTALDDAVLLTKQAELHRSIPLRHQRWAQDAAAVCLVLNISQWKRLYGEESVRRLSRIESEMASPEEG
ncbi:hypothetical protein [cf. Phormidesmis sp. LEGE 11477]|uniref:hypothetical protein n=1 Tax=cf. Phormidesmis sp. LEGE 11477 TaxID=1828680 RepID=UPI00188194CD|nr:hypothetical protein [cf. Phormidesmis sp. LEGE 11477]MBE9061811.1 hypothetical protein [cf. Phormidesmis sp. LEGE 11477]